jgi:hypothetical protein
MTKSSTNDERVTDVFRFLSSCSSACCGTSLALLFTLFQMNAWSSLFNVWALGFSFLGILTNAIFFLWSQLALMNSISLRRKFFNLFKQNTSFVIVFSLTVFCPIFGIGFVVASLHPFLLTLFFVAAMLGYGMFWFLFKKA